jgi:1-deoxy-D-xylulose-5-phosphate reductoisomerase
MKRLAILGSTGSIGCSALKVVEAHPDRLEVVALAAGENVAGMAEQVRRFGPRAVAMAGKRALDGVRARIDASSAGRIDAWAAGRTGLCELASRDDVDVVLCASSGTEGLEAVLAAIRAGKRVALANKEVLVMAGQLVMREARAHGVDVLPVDSEHNAIHQCLAGRTREELRRVILTASGGPFRDVPSARLAHVTPDDALSHPTWRMGRKITIDSATLMNKGLEVIEAHWLFDAPASIIDVVVHPQSIVHGMVEFSDGATVAQLSEPDMRLPIGLALGAPDRLDQPFGAIDWSRLTALTFETPDLEAFPCLALAYAAGRAGGGAPATLSAANEVAVEAFLGGRIPWLGIAGVVEEVMQRGTGNVADVSDVLEADRVARERARDAVERRSAA